MDVWFSCSELAVGVLIFFVMCRFCKMRMWKRQLRTWRATLQLLCREVAGRRVLMIRALLSSHYLRAVECKVGRDWCFIDMSLGFKWAAHYPLTPTVAIRVQL